MFPFSIRYSQKFKKKISVSDTAEIMTYIKNFISQRTGEDIVVDGDVLTFKSRFLRIRWTNNILISVDKGSFHLEFMEGNCRLIYEFYMYRLFVTSILMSVVVGFSTLDSFITIVSFAFLIFFGWLVAIIRHRLMLGEIIFDIETLIIEKKEKEHNNMYHEDPDYRLPGAVDWTPEDGEWKPEKF